MLQFAIKPMWGINYITHERFKLYYPLSAAGQAGVVRAFGLMRAEIERDMKLMGCTAIAQLSRTNLRFR
jgi:isopentenyl diphosphate isomerase/L-lactate dehydrogenase-like FMN-dependent dehydrogenase